MNETLGATGVAELLDFTMYPFGNAYYNTQMCHTSSYDKQTGMYCWVAECGVTSPPKDCFTAPLLCQHGPKECTDNRLEGCVIKHFPNPALYSVFMSCYESDVGPSFDTCAKQAGIPSDTSQKIQSCADVASAAGNAVQAANAQATAALGKSKLGTPWVIVDGEQLQDPDTLLETVCRKLGAAAPVGCK